MTRAKRTIHVFPVLGSLIIAAALTVVAQPASATHAKVTAVQGSGFGYWSSGISLFGGPQADIGPTPTVALATNASNSPQSASAPSGCVAYGPATLLSSDAITLNTSGSLGTTGSVTSTSDIQNVNNSAPGTCATGSEVFGYPFDDPALNPSNLKTDVAGTVTATTTGMTGSTTITDGIVRTDAQSSYDCPDLATPCGRPGEEHTHDTIPLEGVVTVPTNPPPNYKVAGHLHLGSTTTDYFVIVFNEQTVNPDGSLTVTPVHEYFGYKLDGSGNIVQDLPYSSGGSVLHGHLYLGRVVGGVTTASTALPTISVTDTAVLEGDAGTTTANFTISLSAPSTQNVTVNRVTANQTAIAPGDYTALTNAPVTFLPGETFKTVSVTVKGDTLREGNETFRLNLSAATNAVFADSSGTATIIDEEGPSWAYVSDVSVAEGNAGTSTANFTVTVSPAPTHTVTLKVVTANLTATAGSDYVALPSTTVTFLTGETTKTVAVTINGDTTVEPDETFRLTASNPTGGLVLADTQGTATIQNDDH